MIQIQKGATVRTSTHLARAILLGTVLEVYQDQDRQIRFVVDLWMYPGQPIDIADREIEGKLEDVKTQKDKGNMQPYLRDSRENWKKLIT